MRLGEMTKKEVQKPSYNSGKTVAICEFVKIQSPFCGIVGSITLFLKCGQQMRLGKMAKKQFLEPCYNSDESVAICGFA